ncbi:MAG: N-acetyl-gamma-glutamyl-phosphate reductase [Clostridia bacterium]|nr:N-acetyl-gamma-glutamyl-phosphate reductase [Clostridia bacterium]
MTKVFIDGSAGTTGLRIYDRLSARKDIELIILDDEKRKVTEYRQEALNSCDIAFLCLPDDAARETIPLVTNPNTAIIDTSTAHRTNSDWTYGFPEIANLREKIAKSKRIANPGCHASGFVALVQPLVSAGIIPNSLNLTSFSITGYSGGGKKMIAEYESYELSPLLEGPRQYALTQQHKHLKEMIAICKLDKAPVFCPIVANFYSGMEVTVPLFASDINGNINDIKNIYKNLYNTSLLHYDEEDEEAGFMSASRFSDFDDMQIQVKGNDDRILLVARFDNLGKGASGSAIQNMNILMGIDETTGLKVTEER